MSALATTTRLAAGLALGLLVGCQTYYPYGQPGYYYGSPGYPPGAVPPPGTVIQGGPTPTTVIPQAAVPGGGDAPVYDAGAPVGSSTNEKPVPEYDDTNTGSFEGGADGGFDDDGFGGSGGAFDAADSFDEPADTTDSGGFGNDSFDEPVDSFNDTGGFDEPSGGAFDETDSFDEMPADDPGPFGANRPSGGGVELDGIDDGAFEQPIRTRSVSSTRVIDEGRFETADRRPNPFDHDRKGFAWLRGVVDYDVESKTWNLIYDVRPDRDDELGGSVTLVGKSTLFRGLQNDDVVMVEGAIDRRRVDSFGKPTYAVDHLARLVPKSAE